jgi:hypothetical protein
MPIFFAGQEVLARLPWQEFCRCPLIVAIERKMESPVEFVIVAIGFGVERQLWML